MNGNHFHLVADMQLESVKRTLQHFVGTVVEGYQRGNVLDVPGRKGLEVNGPVEAEAALRRRLCCSGEVVCWTRQGTAEVYEEGVQGWL